MPSPSISALSLLALTTFALASAPESSHMLLARDYLDQVCSPNTTTIDSTTVIPPCIEITTIEASCAPNGTAPIDYVAHAECMCGGSYFEEWQGCQDCLFFHGLRTEREEAFYESVLSVASHSLCDFLSTSGAGQPTTSFAALFSAAEAIVTQPTTGATVSSDQAPSATAVSLYFTLTGSQGPGAITGSATSATATGTSTTGGSGSASISTSGTSASKSSSASKSTSAPGGSSTATSSSGSGTYPTKASGLLLLGFAGIAMAVGV